MTIVNCSGTSCLFQPVWVRGQIINAWGDKMVYWMAVYSLNEVDIQIANDHII